MQELQATGEQKKLCHKQGTRQTQNVQPSTKRLTRSLQKVSVMKSKAGQERAGDRQRATEDEVNASSLLNLNLTRSNKRQLGDYQGNLDLH